MPEIRIVAGFSVIIAIRRLHAYWDRSFEYLGIEHPIELQFPLLYDFGEVARAFLFVENLGPYLARPGQAYMRQTKRELAEPMWQRIVALAMVFGSTLLSLLMHELEHQVTDLR